MNDKFRGLERVFLDVAPRFVANGGIRLPGQRAQVAKLPAFNVQDPGVILHGIVLEVDYSNVISIFQRTVVVEGGEASEIRTDRSLADPPVEVHDVRMVFLYQFRRAR